MTYRYLWLDLGGDQTADHLPGLLRRGTNSGDLQRTVSLRRVTPDRTCAGLQDPIRWVA